MLGETAVGVTNMLAVGLDMTRLEIGSESPKWRSLLKLRKESLSSYYRRGSPLLQTN